MPVASSQTVPSTPEGDRFPRGMNNVFGFGVFNALSFQVVLSSPMVLYAKSLGASSTVLGILAGMLPLLVIFQIPAASYIGRVGHKRFVLAGWSARVLLIFVVALLPLTGRLLDDSDRLALLLVLLFGLNLSRGISSAAWLPWITALIPPALRGRYLVREAAFVNFGSFLVFLVCAAMLGRNPGPWQFAALFAFSGLAGVTSLAFLRRVPDVPVPEPVRVSRAPVPWRQIAAHPPFRKLLWLNLAWSIAVGGLGTFVVVFLKVQTPLEEGDILLVSSTAFLGGLSTLWFLGARLDRFGSRPLRCWSGWGFWRAGLCWGAACSIRGWRRWWACNSRWVWPIRRSAWPPRVWRWP
jgi:MFS family permease